MKGLESCPHLFILNMSHNQLATLEDIPLLSSLMQLNLSFNKVFSSMDWRPQKTVALCRRMWTVGLSAS